MGSGRIKTRQTIVASVLIVIALIMAFPFIYLMKMSLQPDPDIFQVPMKFVPSDIVPGNYLTVLGMFPLLKQLMNSAIYSVSTSLLTVATAGCAAYALAKLQLPGGRILIMFFIATMLLPPEIRAIPMYTMMASFSWVDSWKGMIIPLSATGFAIFFVYQYMITIPDELIEAAYIDGASESRIFTHLILPISKTALATMGLYNFLFRWRGFIWPLVMTRGRVTTLSVGLSALKTGEDLMRWNLVGAATMFLFIPSLIMFLSLRRTILRAVAVNLK